MDFLISQLPAVIALFMAIGAVHLVWHTKSVPLAVGLCVVNMMLASEVIHQVLNTFTVFNPGGAFLVSLPLAIVAAQASRNGDDTMALQTVHWSCIAYLFMVLTEFRRLLYLLASTPENKVLIDAVGARNAVLILIGFYFSSMVVLALRRMILNYTTLIWIRLTLPIILTMCVFTPLNIYAVLLATPYETMTEVQKMAVGPWAYIVRAAIEFIIMISLYPLIYAKEQEEPPKVLP